MRVQQVWLPWVRSLLTGWTPLDSLTLYAKWLDKEFTGGDFLLGTVASFLGIVMVSVTFLTISVLTTVLLRLLSGYCLQTLGCQTSQTGHCGITQAMYFQSGAELRKRL